MRFGAILLAGSLVLSACGSDDEGAESLNIVATTSILADIASGVAGEAAGVETLMPRGADPHDYQPSAQQVAAINEADLVVANGLGLEEGLLEVLEAAEADGVNVLRLGDALDPLPFAGFDEEGHEEEDHEHVFDPHFWLDPLRVARAAELIAAEMALIESGFDWSQGAERYAAEMAELDDEIRLMLQDVPAGNRKLVTGHDSLGYFAAAYGFDVIGVIIPGGSTLSDPSSRHLADLVATIEQENVPAIFVDVGQATDLAEAVSAEVSQPVAVVELHTGSLGEPGSETGTLAEMLSNNATLISRALG